MEKHWEVDQLWETLSPTMNPSPIVPFHIAPPVIDWRVENQLVRKLHEYFESFSDKESMHNYGAIWRWRIRRDAGAVKIALERATACRKEIKHGGGYLNREWAMVFKARREKMEASAIK
jgi:hypothetical protein